MPGKNRLVTLTGSGGAGKLGVSGACSNTTQENIFAGIDSNLDSATRSYIAWGLALQTKDDIRACY